MMIDPAREEPRIDATLTGLILARARSQGWPRFAAYTGIAPGPTGRPVIAQANGLGEGPRCGCALKVRD